MLSGLWFSDIYFRLQWPQMAPWFAKNGTLVASNGENRTWFNISCFLDYSHMKSISVYHNYIPYTFKMILVYI